MPEANGFEPDITAFACIYCAYTAADIAGATHTEYPANVKVIKLPCTGKIETIYMLKAFEKGADAVFVAGCTIGNCHHLEGNLRATRRVQYAKQLLEQVGVGGERLDIFYMSGGQATEFANAATIMTERAKKLGPSPLKVASRQVDKEKVDKS